PPFDVTAGGRPTHVRHNHHRVRHAYERHGDQHRARQVRRPPPHPPTLRRRATPFNWPPRHQGYALPETNRWAGSATADWFGGQPSVARWSTHSPIAKVASAASSISSVNRTPHGVL